MAMKEWFSTQYQKYLRVWRILRKPTMDEFKSVAKVSAIGLLVIGAIGFIVNVLFTLIFTRVI
jgi:protein transport protein SEC61 subunit gamma-like protein